MNDLRIKLKDYATGDLFNYSTGTGSPIFEKIDASLIRARHVNGYFQNFCGHCFAIYRNKRLATSMLNLDIDGISFSLKDIHSYEWRPLSGEGRELILYGKETDILWKGQVYTNEEYFAVSFTLEMEGDDDRKIDLLSMLCSLIDERKGLETYLT